MHVDQDGVHLPPGVTGSFDVFFDDHHAWSFSREERHDAAGSHAKAPTLVGWPGAMHRFLDGEALVEIRHGETVLARERLRFGSGPGRVRFVGRDGLPVMIDKWGLIQRPFSGRGSGVVEKMMDVTEQIIEVMDRDCGLQAWIAFGSLLGAAREGRVIAHDSDIDLAYLSHAGTPAAMIEEMYGLTRALRRAGLSVLAKSGSFVTVLFEAPDGGQGSVDVYTCFHVGDLLHETATVRAPAPASIIEPLGTIGFEGRQLPAPARPEAVLELSYGPGWRVPDPSFRHTPGPETTTRFDGWFGSLMKNRREWEAAHRAVPDRALQQVSGFADWVLGQLRPDANVLDLGAGTGADALGYARAGHRVQALDYARGSLARARRLAKAEDLPVTFANANLADRRDALVRAALFLRRPGPRVVTACGVLDSIRPDDRDNVYAVLRLALRRGGTAFLEFAHHLAGVRWDPRSGGRRHPVPPDEVVSAVTAAGGRILGTDPLPPGRDGVPFARTRIAARW